MRKILLFSACICFLFLPVFAKGQKDINEFNTSYLEDRIEYLEDDIEYLEDDIEYLEDDIEYLEDDIEYLEEHIITNEGVDDFEIIEYGSPDYYKSLDIFSIAYENFKDLVQPIIIAGEAVAFAYAIVQTGGAMGFLIPLMGVPTTKQAALHLLASAGKAILTTELASCAAGAVGVAAEYAKYGDVDNGTFLEWHDEAFKWTALYQGAKGLSSTFQAIKAVNTPDVPLRIPDMDSGNTSSFKNGKYAGQIKKIEKLQKVEGAKVSRSRRIVENIGIEFSKDGYPNFKPYAKAVYKSPDGVLPVDPKKAFDMADKSINISAKYRNDHKLVWHHSEDGKTLYLLDRDLHSPYKHGIAHNGGQSLIEKYWQYFADMKEAL